MYPPLPKYDIGSLVKDDKKIYEVLTYVPKPKVNYFYRLRMVSHISDKGRSDAWGRDFSKVLELDEPDLKSFDFRKPKYTFGEEVKYDGYLGKVWFMFYENHGYHYVLKHIMAPYTDGFANHGWAIEEAHLYK